MVKFYCQDGEKPLGNKLKLYKKEVILKVVKQSNWFKPILSYSKV
jgi:hypothetical protein